MRREIVEAVRESVRPCMDEDACGNRGLTDEDAEAIARAVLRAALTGDEAVCDFAHRIDDVVPQETHAGDKEVAARLLDLLWHDLSRDLAAGDQT